MKKFILYTCLTIVLAGLLAIRLHMPADDTAALQAQLDAGNLTLPAGHSNYTVTSLTVNHTFDLNGNTIVSTATGGAVIRLNSKGATIKNGTIKGQWDYNTAYNTMGAYGIYIRSDSCTVYNMHITQFPAYGITCAAVNKPYVTYCTIDKTGYIGFYYDPEAITVGGVFSNNLVDRSMLPASTVQQLAVGIRGSTNTGKTSTGWDISNNTIRMPVNPTSWAAECIEIRNLVYGTCNNNSLHGGSIGLSVVRCSNFNSSFNKAVKGQLEGIEYASSFACTDNFSVADSSLSNGILVDGYSVSPSFPSSSYIYFNGDTVKHATDHAVEIAVNSSNIYMTGCVFSTSGKCVDIKSSTNIFSTNNKIDGGGGASTVGYNLDTAPSDLLSPVNLVVSGGSVTNCTYALFANHSGTNAVVGGISFSGVNLAGTTNQQGSFFSHGAHYGTVSFLNYRPMIFKGYKVRYAY